MAEDGVQLKKQLPWVYVRCTECLDKALCFLRVAFCFHYGPCI